MSRVILYALGQVFEQNKEKIQWENVVAVADKNAKASMEINGFPVITPAKICEIEYDFIIVFSNKLFEQIKCELIGEYFVPPEKIVSWRALLPEQSGFSGKSVEFFRKFVKEKQLKTILDIGMEILPQYYLNKEVFWGEDSTVLDGVGKEKFLLYKNLYNEIHSDIQKIYREYDLILLCSLEKMELLQAVKSRLVMMYEPYRLSGKMQTTESALKELGEVTSYLTEDGIVWVADRKKPIIEKDIQIYVVIHKPFQVKKDSLYSPICVGENYENPQFLSEKTGENISYLNAKINECTALYWIWKHSKADYIGLNHYRRYFYNDGVLNFSNILNKETIYELLKHYDLIMPQILPIYSQTVEEQIKTSINEEIFEKALYIIREMLHKKQPEYMEAFETVMRGHCFYACNMFVARREILNEYCEWLFSFLIEAAELLDITGYDSYSKRAMGFFAERMWTVWLMKQNLKIKELPYMVI